MRNLHSACMYRLALIVISVFSTGCDKSLDFGSSSPRNMLRVGECGAFSVPRKAEGFFCRTNDRIELVAKSSFVAKPSGGERTIIVLANLHRLDDESFQVEFGQIFRLSGWPDEPPAEVLELGRFSNVYIDGQLSSKAQRFELNMRGVFEALEPDIFHVAQPPFECRLIAGNDCKKAKSILEQTQSVGAESR